MIIICRDSEGFTDILTDGKRYAVTDIGANGYLIETDSGAERWLGAYRFSIEGV